MRTRLASAVIYAIYAALLLLALTVLAPGMEASSSRRWCPNPYAVAAHFGTYEGGEGFNPRFDLNGDGAVTVGDIILASNCWLEGTP